MSFKKIHYYVKYKGLKIPSAITYEIYKIMREYRTVGCKSVKYWKAGNIDAKGRCTGDCMRCICKGEFDTKFKELAKNEKEWLVLQL